jgi:hypothetical protein
MPVGDPRGEVALMLCECLLHLMVEERILPKEKAMAAIAAVGGMIHDRPWSDNDSGPKTGNAAAIVAGIAQRFLARYPP